MLVDWDGVAPLLELTKNGVTPEAARRFWLESQWIKQFQSGRCDADAFARGVIAELNLKLTSERFIELFLSWDRGSLPGAHDLLKSLRGKIKLACLSNTNALHWKMHCEHGLIELFDECYPSFEIGLGKPDPAAFEYVIDRLELAPETILYFDDTPECVEAAAKSGMIARHVIGVEQVKAVLRETGVCS